MDGAGPASGSLRRSTQAGEIKHPCERQDVGIGETVELEDGIIGFNLLGLNSDCYGEIFSFYCTTSNPAETRSFQKPDRIL